MTDGAAAAILDLLEQERRAMLSGGFDTFPDLARRKETLFARLVTEAPGVTQLRRIAAGVSRNQRLLQAALRGVQDVGARLTELGVLRDGFSTYDSQGQKSTVTAARSGFEYKV